PPALPPTLPTRRSSALRFPTPLRALRGFSRVSVAPGDSTLATVTFDVDQLALWDTVQDRFVVEDAARELLIGRSATDIRVTTPLDRKSTRLNSSHVSIS